MSDRLRLITYAVAVVAATCVHDPLWLGIATAIVFASAAGGWRRLVLRVARAALPFALAVSLGYIVSARGDLPSAGAVLLRLNLRIMLLTGLAFRVLPTLDLQRALGFSPTLRFVLVLTTSQLLTFRRLFTDFRHGLSARTPRRVDVLTALRHGAATAAWFARRAEHDAAAITQALDARGFFLDRD